MSAPGPDYVELDAMTNFSFLEGGSHAAELVLQAKVLGLNALRFYGLEVPALV